MTARRLDSASPRASGPARARALRSAAYRAAEGRAVGIVADVMRAERERPWSAPAPEVVDAAIRRACAETPGALDDFGSAGRPLRVLDLLLLRAASVRGAALLRALLDGEGRP